MQFEARGIRRHAGAVLALTLVLAFALTGVAAAQGTQSGTLTGGVKSADGAALPGVSVTLVSATSARAEPLMSMILSAEGCQCRGTLQSAVPRIIITEGSLAGFPSSTAATKHAGASGMEASWTSVGFFATMPCGCWAIAGEDAKRTTAHRK